MEKMLFKKKRHCVNCIYFLICRLGFIIDFLSKATLIGFMGGAAIIVSLQQLKGLLGITHFTKHMSVVPVLSSVFQHTNEWSWQTIVMGVCFLLFLLSTRHLSMKKPKLFWVSAGAPLLSVIVSTLLVFVFRAERHGISVVSFLLPKPILCFCFFVLQNF
jgi:sulfate transporter 3